MHNLQHKFLRCTLHRKIKGYAPPLFPGTTTRVSIVQVALFYLHRGGAERRDKIGRLLQLALGGLHDPVAIVPLSEALRKSAVDLDSRNKHFGDTLNLNTILKPNV